MVRCTPRLPLPTVTWARTGAICGWIVRTFVETAAICGKTTKTFGLTVRIFGEMKGLCVMTGNNCSRTNVREPLPGNSNRIGRISVGTDRTCAVIAGTWSETARIGVRIGVICERTDAICTGIAGT